METNNEIISDLKGLVNIVNDGKEGYESASEATDSIELKGLFLKYSAQRAGYARPLRMTRDEWRNYICCVLTVREELIQESPEMVQDLVNHVMGAGHWLDQQQSNRDKAVAIAAQKTFFNQDPNILKYVMETPTDRVTYGDLRMLRPEFEELMQLSIEAGTLKKPIAYETYMNEQFAKNAQPTTITL